MRKIFIKDKENPEEVLAYWREKSPEERLSAVELLREQFYIIQGYESPPRISYSIKLVDK